MLDALEQVGTWLVYATGAGLLLLVIAFFAGIAYMILHSLIQTMKDD